MLRLSILAVAATVALFSLALVASDPTPTRAVEQAPASASADTMIDTPAAQLQQEATTNDDLLKVQMWTVFAAGGAAALGLILFLVRMAMGWVKPPPPQEDPKH